MGRYNGIVETDYVYVTNSIGSDISSREGLVYHITTLVNVVRWAFIVKLSPQNKSKNLNIGL